jgi:hypothetical protein
MTTVVNRIQLRRVKGEGVASIMPCYSHLNPRHRPLYRLRNDRGGREVLVPAEPGVLYVDRETGHSLRVTGKLLSLAPSPSALAWSIESLRVCPSCEQLVQMDLNYCSHDGRRLPPLEGASHSSRRRSARGASR